jgi:hypothetical protein
VQATAATQDAGSSFTASLVILDEFAKMLWAKQLYTAVKPTIDAGGKLFVISTAKGIGNPFHELWIKAERGLSNFVAVFLPWWSRPGRDQAWYDSIVADANDLDEVKQEYCASSHEAFISSGTPRFLYSWLQQQEKNLGVPEVATDENPERFPDELMGIPGLTVYSWPEMDRTYCIGADPSEGLPHSDPSPATIVDMETWEEVAVLDGRFEPTLFAEYLYRLGMFYNAAHLIVGRNNHGHATLAKLIELGYPCLVKYRKDEREGWPENVQTKVQMVDDLAAALKDGVVTIHSAATLSEMQIYQKLENGKTGAPEGYHDDRVVTWCFIATYLTAPKPNFHAAMTGQYSGAGASRLPATPAVSTGLGVRQRLPIGPLRHHQPMPVRGGNLRGLR